MAAVQLVLWLQNRGRDAGRRLSYYGISVVPITVRFRCRAVRQGRGSKDAVGPPIKWSRLRGCACPRYTSFDNISREFGRIERTLFTLDWLLDKDLHQRVTAGLNKGELKDSLAKAVCFNRLGELRDRSFEAQRHRASGLNLVVGAIILWNTVYLERAIGALRQQGRQVDQGLLKHVAPVHWNHINLTGDYSWRQNKRVEKGGSGHSGSRPNLSVFPHIPSSGIFRVWVATWLRACVSLGRTRNIKREARKAGGMSSALNHRAGKCAFAIRSCARSYCKTRRDTKMRRLDALDSRRAVIHFYFCCQVGWQEYSEFSNSVLFISSTPGIGTNRQLGIFRNSEYRKKSYVKTLSWTS
jgi:Tn3 transposase DDE domain